METKLFTSDTGLNLMKNSATIYIVDDDLLWNISMKRNLIKQFGDKIIVKTFSNGESCLSNLVGHIDQNVDVVLLDYNLGKGKNGIDYLNEIKLLSPNTKVYLVSSSNKIALKANSIWSGATKYLLKDKNVFSNINDEIIDSLNVIFEFSVTKLLLAFFLVFSLMGLCLFVFLNFNLV